MTKTIAINCSKFKKIYAAYSCSLILREVKGLEFEKKLKFQSFFSLRGWFCPSLVLRRLVASVAARQRE